MHIKFYRSRADGDHYLMRVDCEQRHVWSNLFSTSAWLSIVYPNDTIVSEIVKDGEVHATVHYLGEE